ncbi:glycosyltransferase [Parabacteroides sp.]
MKKRLLVFHRAIAPYRIDFFNSVNEVFDAKFYFEFKNALEQAFDQNQLNKRLSFIPHYLKPGFAGIKNFRLDIFGILKRENPDIVFVSEYNILGLLVLLYKLLTFRHFKIIVICDDSWQIAQSAKWPKRLTRYVLLHSIFGVILADKKALEWYRDNLSFKAKFLYFPIIQSDKEFRSRLEKAYFRTLELRELYNWHEKKVILFVGRLVEVKNVSLLLRSYQKIRETYSDVVLLIVGEGVLEKELKRQADDLFISDSVVFAGKKEGLELMAYYNLGDLFVLPSLYEPFGTVVNEALLAGCYVLCSSLAGASGLIEENRNGNLFDPQDEESLVRILSNRLQYVQPCSSEDKLKANRMLVSYDQLIDSLVWGLS